MSTHASFRESSEEIVVDALRVLVVYSSTHTEGTLGSYFHAFKPRRGGIRFDALYSHPFTPSQNNIKNVYTKVSSTARCLPYLSVYKSTMSIPSKSTPDFGEKN